MYRVIFKLPLQEESIVTFIINNDIYKCRIACFLKSCYLTLIHDKFLKDGTIQAQKDHSDFVDLIFKEILKSPARKYYYKVLGIDAYGTWPETSVENLEKVLIQIQKDFDNINKESEEKKSKLDFTKFRFKVGDTILYLGKSYKIAGYYFLDGFNNYNNDYGYVVEGHPNGHNALKCGYDVFGNPFPDSKDRDKYYIIESRVIPYSESQSISNNQLKTNNNGNEIKLQRSKAVIIRGEVPEGCRICSKVHKTAISIQSLGYTAISRGD